MVIDNEYKEYLDSKDEEQLKDWTTKVGGSPDRSQLVRSFRDATGEHRERLKRQIVFHSEGKLKTEEQKRTEAIVSSAKAAADSAESAKLAANIAVDALEETKGLRKAAWLRVGVAGVSAVIAFLSVVIAFAALMVSISALTN